MSKLLLAIRKAKESARGVLSSQTHREVGTPVDVRAVADSMGIKVTEEIFPTNKVSGFLKQLPEGKVLVVVNKKHPEERKRFTIAHEIGHFALHALESLHVDDALTAQPAYFRDAESSKATKLKEIEANQFAAELLMPSDEIQGFAMEKIRMGKSVDEAVEELAKQYKVSMVAMAIKAGVASH